MTGSDDQIAKIWDYQTKSCIQTLEGHTNNVMAVAFHPELPIVLTGSEDGTGSRRSPCHYFMATFVLADHGMDFGRVLHEYTLGVVTGKPVMAEGEAISRGLSTSEACAQPQHSCSHSLELACSNHQNQALASMRADRLQAGLHADRTVPAEDHQASTVYDQGSSKYDEEEAAAVLDASDGRVRSLPGNPRI